MDAAEIGPITQAMYAREQGQAPAIVWEWSQKLQAEGQFICLWTGVVRRQEGPLGWGCLTTHFGDPQPSGKGLMEIPAASVERLLSPLAHEGRIRIMQALSDGPLTASQLSDATGFRGGGLYHHLKELQYAAYVTAADSRYRLTQLGLQLLVTVLCMASEVIEDRGQQGLAVGRDWQEKPR